MIGLFTKILSYIFPVKIDEAIGYKNIPMDLFLYCNDFYVQTPNATYAHTSKYTSFQTILHQNKQDIKHAKTALVLGWGLGSIGSILNNINDNLQITGVDIDQNILNWYQRYNKQKNTTIFVSDVCRFLEENKDTFDIIAIDIYIDDSVPKDILSLDFLKKINEKLHSRGSVFLSTFYKSNLEQQACVHFAETIFSKAFADVIITDTKGNMMLKGNKME